jgi:threonine dehydrogenase-like Zn-dependent dehydrogenase
MRGVVFDGIGSVRLADLPDPVVEDPGDAVIRVTRTAICGSDLHLLHGKAPLEPGEPIGHEAVGIVEEIGADVANVSVGDRVVVAFNVACGECFFCRAGRSALCEEGAIFGYGIFGGGLPGAQAERLRVPRADVNLMRVPAEIEDDAAVFVGDALATGFYGAGLASGRPDDVVAVLGCGPVGLCTIHGLRVLGGPRIHALDRDPARLALAEATGANPVHVDERNPATALAEATDGRGADVVVEAVGTPEAFESAIDVVRRGGTVVVLGVYAHETIQAQLGAYWSQGLDLRFAGLTPVLTTWEPAMAAVASGEVDPTPIISHRLTLEDAPRGYELFDRREATKVVLTP